MGVLDKYLNDAPQVESETPSDTLPKGKYPSETINAQVRPFTWTDEKTGANMEGAEASVQLRVLHGPLKGQTTWIRPNISLGEPTGDEAADKRFAYFVQKFYDATGFGRRIDPNWHREERPNPKRTGKTLTVFKGKVLRRAQLLALAKASDDEKAAFCKMLVGLTGIFDLDEKKGKTKSGDDFINQQLRGVEPLNEATLNEWKQKGSGGAPAANVSPSSSPYAKGAKATGGK